MNLSDLQVDYGDAPAFGQAKADADLRAALFVVRAAKAKYRVVSALRESTRAAFETSKSRLFLSQRQHSEGPGRCSMRLEIPNDAI